MNLLPQAYTVNNESNHLLIFNVPSLKLRQETKSLFSKYGKLISFTVTPKHTIEPFTETYHAVFENIQSARIAKKMLDTKNFYGGSLHVCYAPEFESLSQTRQKILQRQRDVLFRLNNLQKEEEKTLIQAPQAENNDDKITVVTDKETGLVTNSKIENVKLYMGEVNTIGIGKETKNVIYKDKGKRKLEKDAFVLEKRFKPCFVQDKVVNKEIGESSIITCDNNDYRISNYNYSKEESKLTRNSNRLSHNSKDIDIIDFTSTDKETISNINEALKYNKFGNEVIRKVENKPLNKIRFRDNKK